MSLPLREGRRLRLFDIRVLRRIYGPKTDEVMGHGRRLHNDELYDVYFSPNIITVAALGAHICEKRNIYGGVFLRKTEEKSPLYRTRRR